MWFGTAIALSCAGPSETRSAVQEPKRSEVRGVQAPAEIGHDSRGERASTCENDTQGVEQELWQVGVAMDQVGALRLAFDHARDLLPKCPSSEPVWYALVRAIEVGVVELPVQLAGQTVGTAVEAARAGAAKCSSSVRIKTVLARLEGTEAAARDALALHANYAPASLALAAALMADGKGEGALPILDTKGVQKLPGANTLRSHALLSLGKVKPAIAAARGEIDEPGAVVFAATGVELARGLSMIGVAGTTGLPKSSVPARLRINATVNTSGQLL